MSWERLMAGEIHIDHIIPKSVFNFSDPKHADFKKCWSLKNLRPMWAVENLKKHNKLEKHFPGLRGKIKAYYTSTPLTYRDYTGTINGSAYGILKDYTNPLSTFISQRTRIPNLFLTGQNIGSHGILGVTIGSLLTCAEFLGLNYLIRKVNEAS